MEDISVVKYKNGFYYPSRATQGSDFQKLPNFHQQLARGRMLRNVKGKGLTFFKCVTRPWLGCDPEIFMQDEAGNLISAFSFLPCKDAVEYEDGSKLFWDGFQAEFTTNPNQCIQSLCYYVQKGLLRLLLAARARDAKAGFLCKDVVEIDPEQLRSLPQEFVELGCDPSFHIYGDKGFIPPDPRELPYRFAGGHIHFGLKDLSKAQITKLIKDLDRFVGLWSLGVARSWERSKLRRQFYGLAGEFRTPPYGFEYRTLSNFWLAAPEIMQLTFEVARTAVRASLAGFMEFWDVPVEDARDMINNYDLEGAVRALKANEKLFKQLMVINTPYWSDEWLAGASTLATPEKIANAAFEISMEGAERFIAKPKDVENNWLLNGLRSIQEFKDSRNSWAQNKTWRHLITNQK